MTIRAATPATGLDATNVVFAKALHQTIVAMRDFECLFHVPDGERGRRSLEEIAALRPVRLSASAPPPPAHAQRAGGREALAVLDLLPEAGGPDGCVSAAHGGAALDPHERARVEVGELSALLREVEAAVPDVPKHVVAVNKRGGDREAALVRERPVGAARVAGLAAGVEPALEAAVHDGEALVRGAVVHGRHGHQADAEEAAVVVVARVRELHVLAPAPARGRARDGVEHLVREQDRRAGVHALRALAGARGEARVVRGRDG